MIPLRSNQFPNHLNRNEIMVRVTLCLHSSFLAALVDNDEVNTTIIASNSYFTHLIPLITKIKRQQAFEFKPIKFFETASQNLCV